MTTPLRIRRETPADASAIAWVHDRAFAPDREGPTWESRLVDDLRAGPSWIGRLSLVAEVDGDVVGHVVASRATVEGRPGVRAVGIAPVGVLPGRQGRHVGTALMYAVLGAADALDEQVVCLLGSPEYYGRFGFTAATNVGIVAPDPRWGHHFQALVLSAGRGVDVQGTFRYDVAFDAPPL